MCVEFKVCFPLVDTLLFPPGDAHPQGYSFHLRTLIAEHANIVSIGLLHHIPSVNNLLDGLELDSRRRSAFCPPDLHMFSRFLWYLVVIRADPESIQYRIVTSQRHPKRFVLFHHHLFALPPLNL